MLSTEQRASKLTINLKNDKKLMQLCQAKKQAPHEMPSMEWFEKINQLLISNTGSDA